jgi:predicted transposase YbfD/YdcC
MSVFNKMIESIRLIDDTRRDHLKKYKLDEVLFLTLCSVISGYSSFTSIETFGEERIDWLRKFLPYSNGAPSHDTIRNCIGIINEVALTTMLTDFVEQIRINKNDSFDTISIDGKVFAGSATAREQQTKKVNGGKSPLKVVTAFSNDLFAVLGIESTGEGSEPDALLRLLENLNIEGKILTADAAYAYHPVLETIKDNKGDFLIAVKNNQPTLHNEIEKIFTESPDIPKSETISLGHGRQEIRQIRVLSKEQLPDYIKEHWPLVEMIVEAQNIRVVGSDYENGSISERYYISSKILSGEKAGDFIRNHWGIENKQHWNLDVLFQEDSSKQRTGKLPYNMGVFRRFALTLLMNNGEQQNVRLIRRQEKCLMNPDYLEKTLNQSAGKKGDK